MKNKKIIYVPMGADIIHSGHLNIIKKAKQIVENDAVIGIPTETVYGLAANAYSDKSVKKIFILSLLTTKELDLNIKI